MIDSVLKGTGNSRFLKSAVPAGTSWADALAMLQAGTFPIDFNGINAEGFQQVGTPLNKANLLKDATAAQIGLPPSTTPDDMFQALAKTGDLHVWRKTVKTSSPIPATFKLEDYTVDRSDCGGNNVPNALLFMGYGSGYIDVASSITVNDSGSVTLNNPTRYTAGGGETNLPNIILGKYIKIYFSANGPVNLDQSLTYFVPSSSSTGWTGSNWIYSTKLQKVVGIPYIPAGTTTTYPVSTNPNAYQEGDNAKPAGYTLGDVVTGRFKLEGYYNSSHPTYYYADNTPTVSDDGVVSVKDIYGFSGYGSGQDALQTRIRGKYIQCRVDDYTQSDFRNLGVVYIPEDAVVLQYNSASGVYIDRYQPVTGYAAIPAGTTIEYLGKLGDKARVQVVSYVGTGTYGSSNPNSLTFDFAPKLVIIRANGAAHVFIYTLLFLAGTLTKTFQENGYVNLIGDNEPGLSDAYARVSGRTLAWYSVDSYNRQANYKGAKYTAIAIG